MDAIVRVAGVFNLVAAGVTLAVVRKEERLASIVSGGVLAIALVLTAGRCLGWW